MFPASFPLRPVFPGLSHDIAIEIAPYLDIKALLNIRATSRAGDELLAAEISRRSRRFLRPFLDDYIGFVKELHVTGSALCGYSALHILYPWQESPAIPVICSPKTTFFHIVAYLVHCEGYTPSCSSVSDSVAGTWVDLTRPGRQIRVLRSPSASALEPIMHQWNTALFAYVRPGEFCAPYASLTSQRRALVNARRLDEDGYVPDEIRDLMRSWAAEGWRIRVTRPRASLGGCRGVASAHCAAAHRFFGDRHCLRGPTQSMRRRDAPCLRYDGFVEWTVLWWRGGEVCNERCNGGEREVVPGHRPCLRVVLR